MLSYATMRLLALGKRCVACGSTPGPQPMMFGGYELRCPAHPDAPLEEK